MKVTTLEQLKALQRKPDKLRNICILAHVDHGKTTIADALVASNGIISKRNAGKIRYMDSREDEQERGITMKSSAITLIYEKRRRKDGDPNIDQYLINLIDSPGHVDFSSEVTTAVRLCDGAIVVVDVVEGVCPQTQAVLRQAWLENIRPVLVLNKLDRLISQLKLTPTEAYYHLIQILEQTNLITNQLFTSEAMEKTSEDPGAETDGKGEDNDGNYDWTTVEDEEEHKTIFFSPALGNVIFASAIDGWGFRMSDFARMYSAKLEIKEDTLLQTLWGDYYINMKAKRIMKGAQSRGKKPLFVQFGLENIWSVYDAVMTKDMEKTEKIVKSLGLTIPPRELKHKDSNVLLQSIMSQWLPLSDAVLETVSSHIPSPLNMTEERVEKLMCVSSRKFSSLPPETQALKKEFCACSSSDESPAIVFVSKMFPFEKKYLPHNKARVLTEAELQERRAEARRKHAEMLARKESAISQEGTNSSESGAVAVENGHTYLNELPEKSEEDKDEYVFIAFARVFSGTIRKGSVVYFLGPKHDPAEALKELSIPAQEAQSQCDLLKKYPHITVTEVKDLYLLMGRELEALDAVPAGNVLGLGGLEKCVIKSGTLASSVACPAFTDMFFDAAPIVRVAVEPAYACDMGRLVAGLRLLNQADPCVEVKIQETGEHVIIAAGEVHLQRCVDDLIKRYAKIEVNVSQPIVPYRETVIVPPKVDMVNETIQQDEDESEEDDGIIQASTADRQCHILLRASPLPGKVTDILLENQDSLKALDAVTSANITGNSELQVGFCLNESTIESLKQVKEQLQREFDEAGEEWSGAVDKIWGFGPRRCGPNVLLNNIKGYPRPSVWQAVSSEERNTCKLAELDNSIVTGFQVATLAGPLCEEPMHGVCFFVEDWWYGSKNKSKETKVLFSQTAATAKGDGQSSKVANEMDSTTPENNQLCDDIQQSVSAESVSRFEKNESAEDASAKSFSGLAGSDSIQWAGSSYGPLSGQLISSMKEGCRRAFQAQPQRLVVAMYKCEVQATVEVLGKMHGVLSKRYGQVISEDMLEGTDIFNICAALPVVESFGFAEDIRKKTSGLASPQLKFSHWEILPMDPFWVPTTEEEYLHFGEKADAENRARAYMNKVRKRKGLPTDEKIVEFAEKQRTLTKMK